MKGWCLEERLNQQCITAQGGTRQCLPKEEFLGKSNTNIKILTNVEVFGTYSYSKD